MSKMRGKVHEDLKFPDLPPIFIPLLDTFNSLDLYTFQELKAYTELTGIRLDSFDISIIKDLDFIKRYSNTGATTKKIMEAFNYGSNND